MRKQQEQETREHLPTSVEKQTVDAIESTTVVSVEPPNDRATIALPLEKNLDDKKPSPEPLGKKKALVPKLRKIKPEAKAAATSAGDKLGEKNLATQNGYVHTCWVIIVVVYSH